ncbi:DUF4372 domain-containing protein [Oceanobacillus sojae]|uniref:DUF4372 domain-containing protein n=1 Tax=Oceanobacillus sojae TaxID=582851 RepID=UPI00158E6BEC|nr:DUF4372 domain-containing protein [Oceanobacillus sojae]MCT1903869.1 DUF4372 domain-containing protein [Oceanobacillus sojae]
MDKNTRKNAFGKWIAPINFKKLFEQVTIHQQDTYTKKLMTEAYLKLMLYAQVHETEGLQVLSDALLDADMMYKIMYEKAKKEKYYGLGHHQVSSKCPFR